MSDIPTSNLSRDGTPRLAGVRGVQVLETVLICAWPAVSRSDADPSAQEEALMIRRRPKGLCQQYVMPRNFSLGFRVEGFIGFIGLIII